MTPTKIFVGPEQLLRDSFTLAASIYHSGYRPDFLLVIWRGGTPIGIAVHEFLEYRGWTTDHATVKAVSYVGVEDRMEPQVESMDSVISSLKRGSRVLLVDDIFDTGSTVKKISEILAPVGVDLKIATVFYKEEKNTTDIVPDYYVHVTNDWIVFPHELMELSMDEVKEKDPFIHGLLNDQPEA